MRPSAEAEEALKCFALFEGDRAAVGIVEGDGKHPGDSWTVPGPPKVAIPVDEAFSETGARGQSQISVIDNLY